MMLILLYISIMGTRSRHKGQDGRDEKAHDEIARNSYYVNKIVGLESTNEEDRKVIERGRRSIAVVFGIDPEKATDEEIDHAMYYLVAQKLGLQASATREEIGAAFIIDTASILGINLEEEL